MTLATAYAHLVAQHAYEARVRAFGLPALLAPYSIKRVERVPFVPEQRKASE